MRVAAWYGFGNGFGTIAGAFIVWALSHANTKLYTHQLTFLATGGMTILVVPFVWYFLDNGPATAKFLSTEDRLKAVERLRANQVRHSLCAQVCSGARARVPLRARTPPPPPPPPPHPRPPRPRTSRLRPSAHLNSLSCTVLYCR